MEQLQIKPIVEKPSVKHRYDSGVCYCSQTTLREATVNISAFSSLLFAHTSYKFSGRKKRSQGNATPLEKFM